MPELTSAPLRWSAFEHEHIERGSDWYWALGIIAICASLTSILFSNILFALLLLLAAVVIAIIARTPPELHDFEISDRGIKVGDTLHRFSDIIAFWVEEDAGDQPLLLIDTTKPLSPNLIIPLNDIEPAHVRAFLLERVEERPMKEPLAQKVLEFFGF